MRILCVFNVFLFLIGLFFPVPLNAASSSYSLDLSGVMARQRMQEWDPAWISEQEDGALGFEYQVDPANGGQVSVWTGSGNPASYSGSNLDYNQFIAAGPAAGYPVRVRMKYEHHDSGAWLSCAHGNDSDNRHHYEVSMQSGRFRIYKFWGPGLGSGTYAEVASTAYGVQQGVIYWIYLTEIRENNDPNGNVTISGELWDENRSRLLSTVSVADRGNLAGRPVIQGSNKRGFGGYFTADGGGVKVFEWHVEPFIFPVDYSTWAASVFAPETASSDTSFGADPDSDGLPNGVEFYLGLNPLAHDLNPLKVRVNGAQCVASYRRKLGRIATSVSIQQTSDMINWSAEGGAGKVVASDGESEQVEVTFELKDFSFARMALIQ